MTLHSHREAAELIHQLWLSVEHPEHLCAAPSGSLLVFVLFYPMQKFAGILGFSGIIIYECDNQYRRSQCSTQSGSRNDSWW